MAYTVVGTCVCVECKREVDKLTIRESAGGKPIVSRHFKAEGRGFCAGSMQWTFI